MRQFGGPQAGSGRKPQPRRDWVRSEGLRISFRPGEIADLRAIAEAWGVPVATVAWVTVHDQLSRWRRRASELGPIGLQIAAGHAVLEHARARMPDATDRGRAVGSSPEAVGE